MKALAVTVLAGLALAGCGGGGGEPPLAAVPGGACALPAQQQEVAFAMARKYFWHDQLRTPDASAATIDAYFDSMLFRPTDRYSFSEPSVTHDQRTVQGVRVGYGYTLVREGSAVRVRNVEPLGPATAAGLRRGDTVLMVDHYNAEQVLAGQTPVVTEPNIERVIRVRGTDGRERVLPMVSAEFRLSPAPIDTVLQVEQAGGGTMPVGYLAYHSFVGYAADAVTAAMQRFADAGVRHVVLDLRYNGGGSVAVARDIASQVGGERTAHKLFAYLRFNKNQLGQNRSYVFDPADMPSLRGVERVVVITSGGTASASELVINGLKPFVPVTLVGSRTYGKPFGSVTQSHCGTTFHAIQFTTLNALGQGDYANGFAADCEVPDDLDHALGDPAERRLAAALHVARTGQCPALPLQRMAKDKPDQVLGETEPAGMYLDR
jgi:carboxyl-terminal processing protease